ncbi:MAG: DNA-directed RNA polymerase subunit G [Thermoprotei archaeon]
MYRYECVVSNIEPLRLPSVYRVYCRCDKLDIVVEMHEEIMRINENENIVIEFLRDKNKCMENDFCGKGYVVSVTKLDNGYRMIFSIGGLLVVIKNLDKPLEFNVMDQLYIGIMRKGQ